MKRKRTMGTEYDRNYQAAIEAGELTFQGKPCPFGHGGLRYVNKVKCCVECNRVRSRSYNRKLRGVVGTSFYCATGQHSVHVSKRHNGYSNRLVCNDCVENHNSRKIAYATPAINANYKGRAFVFAGKA